MNKKYFTAVSALVLLCAPLTLNAATFLTDEDTISQTQATDGDLFTAGNIIRITQPVEDDAFAAGQQIETEATIGQDLYAAGNSILLRGEVGDDIMAAGENVQIAVPKTDDLFVAGNNVSVSKETTVEGDAYLAGENVLVAGTFIGDVRIAGNEITIQEGTRISGNLTTYGNKAPTIQNNVTIEGDTQYRQAEQHKQRPPILGWITSVITWFVIALLLSYLLPGFVNTVSNRAMQQGGKSILVGAIWLILFMPAAIMCAITIVGIPLTFFIITLTVVLIIAGYAVAQMLVGDLLMKRVMKTTTSLTWQHVLLGVVVFQGLQLVPVFGGIATLLLVAWAMGALILASWNLHRKDNTITTIPTRA